MMKGIIDKSRIERIGKYINRQLIVHRNIENDTKWTTEESMIVELYDNYIELISKINNLQQENQQLKEKLEAGEKARKEAIEFIKEYEKNQNLLKWNEEDYIDVINEIKKYLDIDKGE